MDDDETFRADLIAYITNHDTVQYLHPEPIIETVDRTTTIELELYAGDRFKITIEEL